MSTVAEKPDIEPGAKRIIYWTSPTFINDGTVDTKKMIDFLKHQVPNNHFNGEISNTWNPGEEFEVHFSNLETREHIIFRCTLEIRGEPDNYSVECVLCEPKDTIPSVQRNRSAEILALISGPSN